MARGVDGGAAGVLEAAGGGEGFGVLEADERFSLFDPLERGEHVHRFSRDVDRFVGRTRRAQRARERGERVRSKGRVVGRRLEGATRFFHCGRRVARDQMDQREVAARDAFEPAIALLLERFDRARRHRRSVRIEPIH